MHTTAQQRSYNLTQHFSELFENQSFLNPVYTNFFFFFWVSVFFDNLNNLCVHNMATVVMCADKIILTLNLKEA